MSEVIAGWTAWYVNRSDADVADVPAVLVTVTSTAPGVTVAGDGTVIWVGEFTTAPAAEVEPNLTVAPVTNPVPVMTTEVPPPVGPEVGLIEVTVGVTAV